MILMFQIKIRNMFVEFRMYYMCSETPWICLLCVIDDLRKIYINTVLCFQSSLYFMQRYLIYGICISHLLLLTTHSMLVAWNCKIDKIVRVTRSRGSPVTKLIFTIGAGCVYLYILNSLLRLLETFTEKDVNTSITNLVLEFP